MFEMPVLETERLIIREIKQKDYKDMYEYASLPYIGEHAGWEPHTSLSYTKMIIRLQRSKRHQNLPCVFAIVLKSENKMIGTCELYNFKGFHQAELGYTISYKYWNNGYATEAANRLVKYGFDELLLDKIVASSFPDNVPSNKVLQHIGFTYLQRLEKGYVLYDGTIHDLECYEMTREEYLERK